VYWLLTRETTNVIRKEHIPIEEFETLATKDLMTSRFFKDLYIFGFRASLINDLRRYQALMP
jgi:hypothetical protein